MLLCAGIICLLCCSASADTLNYPVFQNGGGFTSGDDNLTFRFDIPRELYDLEFTWEHGVTTPDDYSGYAINDPNFKIPVGGTDVQGAAEWSSSNSEWMNNVSSGGDMRFESESGNNVFHLIEVSNANNYNTWSELEQGITGDYLLTLKLDGVSLFSSEQFTILHSSGGIPEPSTYAMLALGALTLGRSTVRKRRRAAA